MRRLLTSIFATVVLAACSVQTTPTMSHAASTPPSPTATAFAGVVGWSATGAMATGRAFHTATLLRDGTVLVVGGITRQVVATRNVLAAETTAELYDPQSGTFRATGSLLAAHLGGTAVLLADGRVLLVGGSTAQAEIYDPATGAWSLTGSMQASRSRNTATLLPDGRVLVVGGASSNGDVPLDSAELYDPRTATWAPAGPLPAPLDSHTATLLRDGRVLVVGGGVGPGGGAGLALVEIYDPGLNAFAAGPPLIHGRGRHTATLLSDGRVLVAGGADGNDPVVSAELFDPGTATWSETGALTEPRDADTATLLPDGRVLLAGGYSQGNPSAELYDPRSGTWTETSPRSDIRGYHTATLLLDGRILIAGGIDASQANLASAELFFAPPMTDITTPSLPGPS